MRIDVPMPRSIRWRLVLSHTLLSLFAVTLVGLLVLGLLQRYTRTQSLRSLEATARSVARVAAPFLAQDAGPTTLESLVRTAAFMTDARIRILDRQERVLADSESPDVRLRLAWLVPTAQADALGIPAPGVIFVFPSRGEDGNRRLPAWRGQVPAIPVAPQAGPWGRQVTFGEEGVQPEPTPTPTGPLRAVGGWIRQWLYGENSSDQRLLHRLRVPVTRADGALLGYVEVSNPPDVAGQALHTVERIFWAVALVVGLLAAGVGWLLSRGLTAPLQALSAAAARMGQGDLATRAPEVGSLEIREVARQFNRMAAQLQRSFQELDAERNALRRFIADASHELRTPITALRNFVELLQGPAGEDPETRAEFLHESRQQVDRLSWITAHLLDLSRLDAHLVDLHLEPVAVEDLVAAAVAPLRPRAGEKDVALEVDVPEGLTVQGDRGRLEMVVSNLVDNGIKFTPAGGRVRVTARRAWDGVRIGVEDSGPGVPPEERTRIFERFVRGRHAEGVPGTGLGLAIVRSIVEAHGGRVWVEESPLGGSHFVVVLPIGEN